MWKTLARKKVCDFGFFLKVESRKVRAPTGAVISNWPYLNSPNWVSIIPVTPRGKILCFSQRKYAISGRSLAFPGGYIEDGERPLSCAKRELREEAGLNASRWISLGKFTVDANRGMGTGHIFLALEARSGATKADLDHETLDSPRELSVSEAGRLLRLNKFKLLAWSTALALALNYLRDRKPYK